LQDPIPANTWFVAEPVNQTSFSFMSLAVSLSFELDGWKNLLAQFTNSKNMQVLEQLTKVVLENGTTPYRP